jgi:hypothetical protein
MSLRPILCRSSFQEDRRNHTRPLRNQPQERTRRPIQLPGVIIVVTVVRRCKHFENAMRATQGRCKLVTDGRRVNEPEARAIF